MNEQKLALIDAYCRKGCALCRLFYVEESSDSREDFGDSPVGGNENSNWQAANNIWKELMKFTDVTDMNVINFLEFSTIDTFLIVFHNFFLLKCYFR